MNRKNKYKCCWSKRGLNKRSEVFKQLIFSLMISLLTFKADFSESYKKLLVADLLKSSKV